MDFSNLKAPFCPLLTIAAKEPCACEKKKCEWYNAYDSRCSISCIAELLNEQDQQADSQQD